MLIHLGADHGGFTLKETLMRLFKAQGYEVVDEGNMALDPADDFPIFAAKVGKAISLDPAAARGILICRSGAGVDIVANKFPGVRSVLALSPDQVLQARSDDDVNVLSFAADYADEESVKKMAAIFLETPFDASERHVRRVQEIVNIERKIKSEP